MFENLQKKWVGQETDQWNNSDILQKLGIVGNFASWKVMGIIYLLLGYGWGWGSEKSRNGCEFADIGSVGTL